MPVKYQAEEGSEGDGGEGAEGDGGEGTQGDGGEGAEEDGGEGAEGDDGEAEGDDGEEVGASECWRILGIRRGHSQLGPHTGLKQVLQQILEGPQQWVLGLLVVRVSKLPHKHLSQEFY